MRKKLLDALKEEVFGKRFNNSKKSYKNFVNPPSSPSLFQKFNGSFSRFSRRNSAQGADCACLDTALLPYFTIHIADR